MEATNFGPDIDQYKIEMEFYGAHVVHPKRGPGGVDEKWERVKRIGAGGFGVVDLEKETMTNQLRAVKRLHRGMRALGISRELRNLIAVGDVWLLLVYLQTVLTFNWS